MSTPNEPDTNPFAPPSARVADVPAVSAELEPATRGTRLGAYLIDMIVMMVLFAVVGFTIGVSSPFSFPGNPSLWSVLSVGGILVLYLIVNGYYLVTRGQSIGKMATKIRIVRSDGSRATAGRILGLRYGVNWLLMSIPFIGSIYSVVDSLCIFRESRRCVHDDLADTIVVKA